MPTRLVACTLMIALIFVAPRAGRPRSRHRRMTSRPTWPPSGLTPCTTWSRRKRPGSRWPRGSTASRRSPSTRRWCGHAPPPLAGGPVGGWPRCRSPGAPDVSLAHRGQRRARPHDPWPLPVADVQELEGHQCRGAALCGPVPSRGRGEQYQRSVVQGRRVADALLAWAATDGFARINNCPYVPARVPGAWEPTPPAFIPTRSSPAGPAPADGPRLRHRVRPAGAP